MARRLKAAMPEHTHIARLAGDEFVVLDGTVQSLAEAHRLADKVLALFREPIHVGVGDMYVMASIGVAVAPRDAVDAQELQRNADTALCRAKESGGNCVQVFDDAMFERVFHRLEIESGLHRALERRELHLYYQPIVDLLTGEVHGFEALMRWQRPDGRIISPAEFIPVAEDTGLIVGIGNWALLEALTQLRTWIDEGVCARSATMSVNVSPRQLQDPSLYSAVDEALRRSGVSPRNVWLEVTESVMISDPDQALAALRRLRGLDVRLAIDDFGTGYSSLGMLRRFPLQRIKIDRSFITGMNQDESANSLVRTIVAMAKSLNLDLVAEGLESKDQLRELTAMGCRKAQGFLIASPVQAGLMRETVLNLDTSGLWTGGRQLSLPND
ncbi:MAG: bifunctional diguanylate cyclase/phosphodiesterase [Ilumatobacteraceae bacterium]